VPTQLTHLVPFIESDFAGDVQTPCSLLPGEPAEGRPVTMRRGPSGRAWRAQRAGRVFTVTIEDGHDEVLAQVLNQCSRLPLPYLVALEIVSDPGEDGLALYKSLGGSGGHGSMSYVNVIESRLRLMLHEFGHAEFSVVYACALMRGTVKELGRCSPERLRLWRWALQHAMCLSPQPGMPERDLSCDDKGIVFEW